MKRPVTTLSVLEYLALKVSAFAGIVKVCENTVKLTSAKDCAPLCLHANPPWGRRGSSFPGNICTKNSGAARTPLHQSDLMALWFSKQQSTGASMAQYGVWCGVLY